MNVNDFSIHVATSNGTGSQSSNQVLMRGVLNMGIPVVAKNMFPSNISGLPTWYNLRVTKDDFRTRKLTDDILVCMNQETVLDDLRKAAPGTIVFMRDKLVCTTDRTDLTVIPFPADEIVRKSCEVVKIRKLVVNFVYVGVLQEYLGIDRDALVQGLAKVFSGKDKVIAPNLAAMDAGAAWAKENLPAERRFRVEPMDKAKGRFVIDGNDAAALGAMFGGCTFVGWYPITPSSSLCESFMSHCEEHRTDPDGKRTYAIIQAEDELASLGMVLGASWAGARSMTATAGPGVSLMSEFTGLGYFTETPAVIVDVQRMGPSTGLPTRTAQGDILSTYYLSHGDAKHVMLFPANPEETFDDMVSAFDLADRLQTPVFVMLDLDLGMNSWMCEGFAYPEKPIDRGKILTEADLAKMTSFRRYADVDGDGIPYRTIAGVRDPKGAWFARGTGHSPAATYSEDPDNYRDLLVRLGKKFETARKLVPAPVEVRNPGAKVGFIHYGTSEGACREAVERCVRQGTPVDSLRLRALPVDLDRLRSFVSRLDRVYVVDQNRDGQMAAILRAEVPDLAPRLLSITHFDGLPLAAGHVLAEAQGLSGVEV